MPFAVAGAAAGIAGSAMSAGSQEDYINQVKQMYEQNQQNLQPYMNFGQTNLPNYQNALGQYETNLGTYAQPYTMADYQQSPLYTPMVSNLAELQATPGYQFQLQQGLQGVQNSAAATGGLLSGAAAKAMNNYAQNQASTGFQNAWQRAQQAYGTAFNQNLSQNAQIMNMYGQNVNNYGNASGVGLNAASTLAGTSGAMANAMGQGYQNLSAGQAGIGQQIGSAINSMNEPNSQGYTGWQQIGNWAGGLIG